MASRIAREISSATQTAKLFAMLPTVRLEGMLRQLRIKLGDFWESAARPLVNPGEKSAGDEIIRAHSTGAT